MKTWRILWRRAPAWRMSLLAAVVCSALFFIFPPRTGHRPMPPPLGVSGTPATFTPTLPPLTVPPTGRNTPPLAGPPVAGVPQPVPSPSAVTQGASLRVIASSAPNAAPAIPGTPTGEQISLMGKTFTGRLPYLGRQLPLPPGTWTVVAQVFPSAHGDGSEGTALAEHVNARLVGLTVFTGTGPQARGGTGYRPFTQCQRTALTVVVVHANEEFGVQNCWTINHNTGTDAWSAKGAHPLMRAAAGALQVTAVAIPETLLSVYYRLADKQGFLNVLYYFNPEREGIRTRPTATWEESDWHRDYIARYPDKVAYVQRLKAWATAHHQALAESFFGPSSLHSRGTPQ